jgi:hypothetical protein
LEIVEAERHGTHPDGRIQVTPGTSFAAGTIFMGVDVAAWLDEQMRERDAWRKQG